MRGPLTLVACAVTVLVSLGGRADGPVSVLDELLPAPKSVTRTSGTASAAALARVAETVGDVGAPANLAAESYRLTVGPDGVTVVAPTDRGRHYARRTLEQLKALAGGGPVPACTIVDWPSFEWRGLLLDVGRNYASLSLVLDTIDFLSRYKCNVFHWHLADYHGWRLESKRYPQLQSAKAFTRQVGRYYTQDEFRRVVAYAAERGVTIVPELDMPGHSLAFRKAFGFEKMNTPGVEKILCELIDELCSLAPASRMPVVHIGTDEVRQDAERVPDAWYALWAQRVNDNGRTVMGWWPGHELKCTGPVYQETWYETQGPTGPYVDATCYYIDSWDPAGMLAQATFKRPCPFPSDPAFRLGGELQAWHDDPIQDSEDLARDNPLFGSIVLFSDSFWNDRPAGDDKLIFCPPGPGQKGFDRLVDLERRVLAQRDRVLADFNHPLQLIAQTHMRWRLADATGRTVVKDIPMGAVYASNPKPGWGYAGFVDSPTGVVELSTSFVSPRDLEAGALIELSAFHRSGARAYGLPKAGEWNRYGATVELNGERIPPPAWNRPGWTKAQLADVPWTDESGWIRAFTPIRIRKGRNVVRIRCPKTDPVWYWGATFIPVTGTRDRPREIPGLVFSSDVR